MQLNIARVCLDNEEVHEGLALPPFAAWSQWN